MYNINNIKIKLIDESVNRLEDISDEEYFKGLEFSGYISNSSMALINPSQGGSPTKFLTGFSNKKSGGALELGSAVHRMILEKDQYYIDELDKPSEKVCNVMDYYHDFVINDVPHEEAIKEACIRADYYAKNLTQTRIDNVLRDGEAYLNQLIDKQNCTNCIVLTREHKDKLDRCLISIKNNKNITNLIEGATSENFQNHNEDVIIMKVRAEVPSEEVDNFSDVEQELFLKVKIDNWTIDFENKIVTLNDLKTTGGSIADFCGGETENMNLSGEVYTSRQQGSFEKFHYYRQMAFYMRVLKAYVATTYNATEDNGWTFKCNMLVVETNEPHYSHVFEVGPRWLSLGTYEYESLLKRIAYHKVHGYDSFINIKINGTTVIW